jgi:hypothetical protein
VAETSCSGRLMTELRTRHLSLAIPPQAFPSTPQKNMTHWPQNEVTGWRTHPTPDTGIPADRPNDDAFRASA